MKAISLRRSISPVRIDSISFSIEHRKGVRHLCFILREFRAFFDTGFVKGFLQFDLDFVFDLLLLLFDLLFNFTLGRGFGG